MKFGPLTFQWACLTWVCRSLQSASRALSSSIPLTRVVSGRSFLVLNVARLLFRETLAGMTGGGGLGSQEGQQVFVDSVLVRGAQAVRGALVHLQGGALDELGLEQAGVGERHDLVVVALEDERRYVELLQVLGLVCLGERLDAEVGGREAGHHALQPEGLTHPFRDLRARAVVAVERQAEVLEELRAVGKDSGAEPVEHLHRQTAEVGSGFQHQRRHGADQDGFGYALRAMAADVAGNLPAGGVADVAGVRQAECLNECREVVGVCVHVVAVPELARTAVAAAVVGDAAVAVLGQEYHLIFPRVGTQRPTVTEDDGLAGAPVLVVNGRSVFGCDRVRHDAPFLFSKCGATATQPSVAMMTPRLPSVSACWSLAV